MRMVGRMALGLVLLAGAVQAEDIYRSTDGAGRPVFSNGPPGGGDARRNVAALGRARTRNAGGNEATGGVRAAAADVRSEEEKSLATEREQVAQHVVEVRGAYARLRQEVTARFGGTPSWWIELR